MNNSDYWRGRFSILEDSAHKEAENTLSTLEGFYNEAQQSVQKEIESWYGRFAKNNQISLADARKWLTTGQLEEFKWSVDQYIKAGQQANLSTEWLKKLENASAKFHVSRLEAVQVGIQQQLELLYGNQVDELDDLLKKVAGNGYSYTAYEVQKGLGLGWDITALDQTKLETLLSKPWTTDNRTFRDRCWQNIKGDLADKLHKDLTQSLLRGDSPEKLINSIKKDFGVTRYQARRLVHTETSYFNARSTLDSYKDLGVEKVEIIETLDSRTCELCGPLDGKVIDITDYEPGVTVPPFHPNCRGTTAPAYDDMDGERAARNAEGEVYYVPANMKYADWKKTFVEGGSKSGLTAVMNFTNIANTVKSLDADNVEHIPVTTQKTALSESEIITALGGGDQTSGSCASVALAYAGQKQGWNVLDFRGGKSMDFFSNKMNKVRMFKELGVNSIVCDTAKTSVTNGKRILSQLVDGKEYYLSVGRHAAVVRSNNGVLQYLELQSSKANGWKDFGDIGQTLKYRFGCSSSSSRFSTAYATDIDQLNGDDFKHILGYINTDVTNQRKGLSGSVK